MQGLSSRAGWFVFVSWEDNCNISRGNECVCSYHKLINYLKVCGSYWLLFSINFFTTQRRVWSCLIPYYSFSRCLSEIFHHSIMVMDLWCKDIDQCDMSLGTIFPVVNFLVYLCAPRNKSLWTFTGSANRTEQIFHDSLSKWAETCFINSIFELHICDHSWTIHQIIIRSQSFISNRHDNCLWLWTRSLSEYLTWISQYEAL